MRDSMPKASKREKWIERIESHLRYTARHLVKFDSLEETLHYIVNSFWLELPCDFVGIIVKENNKLIPKSWKGGSDQFQYAFPISLDRCSPNILEEGWDVGRADQTNRCDFQYLMQRENISTWFTLPLKEDDESIGFCIVGFHNFVPLIYETEQIFVEFGKDIAVAMKMAQNKEIEKKKMRGIKWFNENIFPGSSMEQLVEKIVELAVKGTNAQTAFVYLFNDKQNCFEYQPPCYGSIKQPTIISIIDNRPLEAYFPHFEQIGGNELSIPLIVNLKTIGILHVADKENGSFTDEDFELLEFLARHISALLENARLYQIETNLKNRLQTAIKYQQELVKQTLDGENFSEISSTLSQLFSQTVILFDQFLRPISYHLWEEDTDMLESLISIVLESKEQLKGIEKGGKWLQTSVIQGKDIGVWPVIGGGERLGFLVLHVSQHSIDDVHLLTVENALNVYAIQFIKQKLVMDTKEQVKDSFINKLFEADIIEEKKLLESANLFHLNLFERHRIAVITIESERDLLEQGNVLDVEAEKTRIWMEVKELLSIYDQRMILTRKDSYIIAIVPEIQEGKEPNAYWGKLCAYLRKATKGKASAKKNIYIGIGGKTEELTDYYLCYKQAIQSHKVVISHFNKEGYAFFEDLGVYTLLNNMKDASLAHLFIQKHLYPLLSYKEGKGADLFQTLRMYLFHNGNWKETMEALFIHRSTLRYRLDRIKDILQINLDDAENRLNLMIAYKLYDLFGPNGS